MNNKPQILSQWQAALAEARNLAARLDELGEGSFAELIYEADGNHDADQLVEALTQIVEDYEGEKAELVQAVADAIAMKVEDVNANHKIDYLNGAGEWLPRVPYGLEPYGLVETDYQNKDGYMFRGWTFPGSNKSEKLGALFIAYDLLTDQNGDPHIGFRLFFEQDAVDENIVMEFDEEREIEIMVNSEDQDISIYKCIVSDLEEGTVSKTLSLLMDAIYDEETFQLLEEVASERKHLHVIPGAEEIPNLL